MSVSQALFAEAEASAAALQRVLKAPVTDPTVLLQSADYQQLGPMMQRMVLQKALPSLAPLSSRGSGWWPIIREPTTGAWQRNQEIASPTALAYGAVYACVTLIAADIAKLCLRLVKKDASGIWIEDENPAWSPVLRKPNRYQTIVKFIEQWLVSKLTRGNTYVLKQRDDRRIVTSMYVLDPSRVTPLVTPDGAVYYQINRDDLAEVKDNTITVPASEIIHDIMCALYHPLIGVTPIYACGMAAVQGLAIQNSSTEFFDNHANPGGMLTTPGAVPQETVERLLATFKAKKPGETIIAGDGLKYEKFTMTAVDAQLIEQLKWTADTVCSCFHVPPYMIGVGPPPPYANVEPLVQQYYAQCLQSLMTSLETCLDEGLGVGQQFGNRYGTEFDINDLIWTDTATKTTAASGGIGSGGMTVNEARKRYFNLPPVGGGDSCYMQQQNYSLEALAERDANQPFSKPAPAPSATTPGEVPPQLAPDAMNASFTSLLRKSLELAA